MRRLHLYCTPDILLHQCPKISGCRWNFSSILYNRHRTVDRGLFKSSRNDDCRSDVCGVCATL